ncbi:hypothetical protein L228DRAFT_266770 [Xylona heveae TC161]|uniref:Uncharacterized protein n=1 Tax=Xylona heveae (strain CBS 132557 / TC161) TaxID=1328760 RepID=A0A165I5W6_XYLHT|nr:hypothetical protein L228DRAFT_266770 [Xylona heveae TC161]KZF24431.1 hypothetical protein L228DRAFT_266770 [Xylona heveae TC161]
MISVIEHERERARKAIHQADLKFVDWLEGLEAVPDTDNLIPFTRWITPTNISRRFTTQMYLYFLPLQGTTNPAVCHDANLIPHETTVPIPTSDGGIEHTSAEFLPAARWLSMARANDIILFPPQFYLLHIISQFLHMPSQESIDSVEELKRQRAELLSFIKSGHPPWGERYVCPRVILWEKGSGRAALALDKAGKELEDCGKSGIPDQVILVNFGKNGPRDLEISSKTNVLKAAREKL